MTRPDTISERDYLTDEGLAAIEALVARAPQDFDISVNAYPKSVQVTMRWDRPEDVFERAKAPDVLFNLAMCTDTLCKNLRAERAARDRPASPKAEGS